MNSHLTGNLTHESLIQIKKVFDTLQFIHYIEMLSKCVNKATRKVII